VAELKKEAGILARIYKNFIACGAYFLYDNEVSGGKISWNKED
jgi:hypothetical protein